MTKVWADEANDSMKTTQYRLLGPGEDKQENLMDSYAAM